MSCLVFKFAKLQSLHIVMTLKMMLGGILNNKQHHWGKHSLKTRKKNQIRGVGNFSWKSTANHLWTFLLVQLTSPHTKEGPRCSFFVEMLSYVIIQSLFHSDASSRLQLFIFWWRCMCICTQDIMFFSLNVCSGF